MGDKSGKMDEPNLEFLDETDLLLLHEDEDEHDVNGRTRAMFSMDEYQALVVIEYIAAKKRNQFLMEDQIFWS